MNLTINDITRKVEGVINNFEYPDRIKRVGIFGSVARGTAGPKSDIDLVVDYKYQEDSLDDIVLEVVRRTNFDDALRKDFGEVDLSIVTWDALEQSGDKILKQEIEKDVIWIYG